MRVTPELTHLEVPPPGDLALSRITRLQLRGSIPPGAQAFRWAYPAEYGSSVLRLKREGDAEVVAVWLKDGAASEPFPLAGPVAAPSRAQVAWQYTALGFTHILPYGLDHILFVLGLFLLSARLKPLLWQVNPEAEGIFGCSLNRTSLAFFNSRSPRRRSAARSSSFSTNLLLRRSGKPVIVISSAARN